MMVDCLCLDPTDLNEVILREHCPLKTLEEVVARVPNAKVFSVIDATIGYWQLPLSDESSYLKNFNTLFWWYRYVHMPFIIQSANEVWQRTVEEEFGDIEGVGDFCVCG